MEILEWLDKSLYERLISRWDELDAPYARLKTARETICNFFRPDLVTELKGGNPYDMDILGENIIEGTPLWAARTMAIGFQSHQFSKAIDWLFYRMGDTRLQGIDELDMWCQDIRDHNSQVYQRGNFYDVQPHITLDAITIGSPVAFGEEDITTGEILWIPQHFSTYRLFYDRFNRVEGIIIKDPNWTAKMFYDKFCTGKTKEERVRQAQEKFSTALFSSLSKGLYQDKYTLIRALFKLDDPIWYGVKGIPLGGQIWVDVYFEEKPKDKDKPLEISGYFSKPFVVWDYNKKFWESSSRTPAFEAIWDDVTLQSVFKNYVENVQLQNRPPTWYLREMSPDFSPGGAIRVDRSQWQYKPEKVDIVGEVRLEMEQANLLRENLERHFHTRLFNIMSEIAMQKKQPLTATHILEIAGERITLISPMLESNDNYLKQIDDRVMDIEQRAGRGPFAPDILAEISDIVAWYSQKYEGKFDVVPEFIGKLRRAQQMEQAIKPIRLGLAMVQEIGAVIDPDLPRMAIRGYDVLDKALTAVSFPMDTVRPPEEYQANQAALDESRQKQLQTENLLNFLKATKSTLTKNIEPDSPAALLTGEK